MSVFVESLKRLYSTGRIPEEKLNNLRFVSKLTQVEYDYIKASE